MKKIFKYNFLIFVCLMLLTGCGSDGRKMAYGELNVLESSEKENTVEQVLLTDGSYDVSEKDEKYTEYIKEYLRGKFLEIEGIDNISINIVREEDVDSVDVEVVFGEPMQEKEALIESIEMVLMKYFPEGTIITVKES